MRWLARIDYRTESGVIGVEHDIEELEDLQKLVERGPDWNCIDRIEITLERRSHRLTVEQAAKL